jgi:hypothetical protein
MDLYPACEITIQANGVTGYFDIVAVLGDGETTERVSVSAYMVPTWVKHFMTGEAV